MDFVRTNFGGIALAVPDEVMEQLGVSGEQGRDGSVAGGRHHRP
jgi:hypothetical protein